MRIDRLEVKGFGKINGLTIPLAKGMNIVYGNNETGKTTLQWFIRGMLFGLKSGRQSKNSVLPLLKRFRPWDGGFFGGALLYTLDDGNTYRVERDFKAGAVKIFDEYYNDITGTFETARDKMPMFAERQLGVDEATFERTAWIRQMGICLDGNDSAALAEKLVNATDTGHEEISLYRAEKALTDAIKNNIGTDRTRVQPLDKLEERLGQLNAERSRLEGRRDNALFAEKRRTAAVKQRETLKARRLYLDAIGSLIELRKTIDANLKKEARLIETVRQLKELEAKAGGTQAMADRPPKRTMVKGFAVSLACLIIAAAFFVFAVTWASIGALQNAWTLPVLYCTGFLFSGAAAVWLLITFLNNRRNAKEIDDASFDVCRGGDETAVAFSSAVSRELMEASKEAEAQSGELERGIAAALDMKSEALGPFATEELEKTIYDSDIASLEKKWKIERDGVDAELLKAELEEKYCEKLLEDDEDVVEDLLRVEEGTVAAEEKISYLKHKEKALRLALKALTEAGFEIRQTIAPDLNQRMSSIISGLTAGRYNDLRGNDRLLLRAAAPEGGNVRDVPSFSAAAIDQMYLALRLATSELLTSAGESMPLIMDEVFSQFDDSRTAIALKYFQVAYDMKQIVLFTCKRREVELACNIYGDGMNLVELECD